MKKALCVGINNYPGTSSDLKGCVNDANDWTDLLREYGFTVEKLLDSQGTRTNIKNKLSDLVNQAGADDVIVFTYSGHGTSVYDLDGEEGDGYDEALSVYDGTLKDDELREIIKDIHPDASLVVISDSCFSGTVTRVLSEGTPRYMPPEKVLGGGVKQRLFYPESGMDEVLISGCSDREYSYDAYINGRYNGAMSRYAIDTIRANKTATYEEFYSNLRSLLPSGSFPQTPQLEGNTGHKGSLLFEKFNESTDQEPGPEPGENGSMAWYWWVVIVAVIAVIIFFFVGR